MLYKIFNKIEPKSELQKIVSKLTNCGLLRLRENYDLENREIIFTKNYNIANRKKYKSSPRHNSLQRKLMNSFLFDIKDIFDTGKRIIDVGGGSRAYGKFLGFPESNISVLDIANGDEINYQENAEGECLSVPKNSFDYALSLNYFMLAENPENVIKNTSFFLKEGGLVIFDFPSLNYWYVANDGMHCRTYHPTWIKRLVKPYFSEFLVVPIGNFISASFNHYAKLFSNKWVEKFFQYFGLALNRFDRNPLSAMTYVVIAKK